MRKEAKNLKQAKWIHEHVDTDKLLFDSENPRLVEYLEGKRPTQEDLLRILWEQMAVDELAMSIAASGYFEHQPLFVISEKSKLIVIEGNRRLAAVKLLRDASLRKELRATDLPSVSRRRVQDLATLPVFRTTRKEAWQYLGFTHVNGPAKWESYSKAQYIAQVHNEFGVPLDDIARQIGDRHQTVQRFYRALMVIEQAEKAKVFNRSNRYKGHFSFSHLYTGLDYEGIAAFLELRDVSMESRKPVPRKRMKELGEFCKWLYGNKSRDEKPVVHSQNPHLRQLDEVLRSQVATASLRADMPLSVALDVSYGDDRIFSKALHQAREELRKAHGTLSTGFHGDKDLLDLGDKVADLANDLAVEMERKCTPRRRRKRSEQ